MIGTTPRLTSTIVFGAVSVKCLGKKDTRSGKQENFHNQLLKSKRALRKMCRFLRNNNCEFSVEQNRHIKISIQNLDNAQTTFLVISVSPSDVNFEKAFYKQASERLLRIGIRIDF